MARRRAFADEYAVRVNRATALLAERAPAAVVWALVDEYGLSERQARRYVRAAERCPDGMAVPERMVVFTVRLPESLAARVRAAAAHGGVSLSAATARALRAGLGHERSARGGASR
jgi:hypothetical protein